MLQSSYRITRLPFHAILLAIALVFGLAGCASTSSQTDRNVETAVAGSSKTTPSAKVSQARDPAKIYGDAALDAAYAQWAADGYPVPKGADKYELEGKASWYGPGLNGNKTANGETFDMYGMTAAHKKLPFGSIVVVTNRENGKSVVVRINDRGPFVRGRIIDLSYGAAHLLDMERTGVVDATVEVIRLGK